MEPPMDEKKQFFELTNEQRRFFALPIVSEGSFRLALDPSPYDRYDTVGYAEGNHLYKLVQSGEDYNGHYFYNEYQVDAVLSDDYRLILPKKAGKPKRLTASSAGKLTGIGMRLLHNGDFVILDNLSTQQTYYSTAYEDGAGTSLESFQRFIIQWCSDSTQRDLDSVNAFAVKDRVHVKYREGDYFRFKIGRRLYGYGRILLDVNLLRKKKTEFWDCYMTKPLIVAVYHIVTERTDVSVEELENLMMLPSQAIMDNALFYGDFEIFDNRPINESITDYPINYGESFGLRDHTMYYQQGRLCLKADGSEDFPWKDDFRNAGIGSNLDLSLPILLACIREKSNLPYWEKYGREDLRNPKYHRELLTIREKFGLL